MGSDGVVSVSVGNVWKDDSSMIMSPGGVVPSRLSMVSKDIAVISTGSQTYAIKAVQDEQAEHLEWDVQKIRSMQHLKEIYTLELTCLKHSTEVQALFTQTSSDTALDTHMVSVDAVGVGLWSKMPIADMLETGATAASDDMPMAKRPKLDNESEPVVLKLEPERPCEAGPTSVSIDPRNSHKVSIARWFGYDVSVFDMDVCVRRFTTASNPSEISYVEGSSFGRDPLIGVVEGHIVSVFDVRTSERGGRVQQLRRASCSRLTAMSASAEGSILTAGEDKTLYGFDARTWKPWKPLSSHLKYEVVSIHMHPTKPDYCFVSGQDSQIVCIDWKNSQASTGFKSGFRGDTRWTGIDIDRSGARLMAISDSGTLFCADNAHNISEVTRDKM